MRTVVQLKGDKKRIEYSRHFKKSIKRNIKLPGKFKKGKSNTNENDCHVLDLELKFSNVENSGFNLVS